MKSRKKPIIIITKYVLILTETVLVLLSSQHLSKSINAFVSEVRFSGAYNSSQDKNISWNVSCEASCVWQIGFLLCVLCKRFISLLLTGFSASFLWKIGLLTCCIWSLIRFSVRLDHCKKTLALQRVFLVKFVGELQNVGLHHAKFHCDRRVCAVLGILYRKSASNSLFLGWNCWFGHSCSLLTSALRYFPQSLQRSPPSLWCMRL